MQPNAKLCLDVSGVGNLRAKHMHLVSSADHFFGHVNRFRRTASGRGIKRFVCQECDAKRWHGKTLEIFREGFNSFRRASSRAKALWPLPKFRTGRQASLTSVTGGIGALPQLKDSLWTALLAMFYGRNKSADTLKRFANVRTCASVNFRSPRKIIPPSVRWTPSSRAKSAALMSFASKR